MSLLLWVVIWSVFISLAIYLFKKGNTNYSSMWMEVLGMIIIVFLFLSIVYIPSSYYDSLNNLQEFNAIKETVETQRLKDNTNLERATLTREISEANQWLRSSQFWNKWLLFDVAITDKVDNLEPIK